MRGVTATFFSLNLASHVSYVSVTPLSVALTRNVRPVTGLPPLFVVDQRGSSRSLARAPQESRKTRHLLNFTTRLKMRKR